MRVDPAPYDLRPPLNRPHYCSGLDRNEPRFPIIREVLIAKQNGQQRPYIYIRNVYEFEE